MRPLMLLSAFVFDFSKWALRRKILKIVYSSLLWDEFLSDGAITLPAEDDAGGDVSDGTAIEEEGGV